MNELQIFNSEEFGEIRTVTIDNEPWFVGKDVATALGYNEPHKAMQRHVYEDDRMKYPVTDSTGRKQDAWITNESGLYALIFGSKLESAKRFSNNSLGDSHGSYSGVIFGSSVIGVSSSLIEKYLFFISNPPLFRGLYHKRK